MPDNAGQHQTTEDSGERGFDALTAAFVSISGTKDERSVLSSSADPFRLAFDADDPAVESVSRDDCAWLADQLTDPRVRLPIHIRGLHYVLVSMKVVKPNGSEYLNNPDDYDWLQKVINHARWLGYVDWDDITDERNAEPKTVFYSTKAPKPQIRARGFHDVVLPRFDALFPHVSLDEDRHNGDGFTAGTSPYRRQRYHLALIGEKSSLENVLGPIAKRYHADLYLPTGNLSNTQAYTLAKTSAADGRPLRVLYFADCDPSGYRMSVEVARKLQAFKTAWFEDLEFVVYRVGLTPDQVREHTLPQSMIKETDTRAHAWEAATGVKQTEIDALAALDPELLERITLDAIAPFYDDTLDRRIEEYEDEWLDEAHKAVKEHLGEEFCQRCQDVADRLHRLQIKLNARVHEIVATVEVDRNELDNIGLPDIELPEAEESEASKPDSLVVDSEWDYAKAVQYLQKEHSYGDTAKAHSSKQNKLERQREKARTMLKDTGMSDAEIDAALAEPDDE